MNTKEKMLVNDDLWEDDDFAPDKQMGLVPDTTKKAEEMQSDPVEVEGKVVPHVEEGGETEQRKVGAESGRSGSRSALATEREKRMQAALEEGGVCVFGGTLFRYKTPGGEPRVGFAVTKQSESDARATSAIYERVCNPYHGFTPYEGVTRLNDCHVYSFQVYGDCESVYTEVCRSKENPDLEVIDSTQLLKQLAQTIFCHSSICGNTYVPLNCLCPHTVFVQRAVPDSPRVIVLPIVLPRGSADRTPEIPNDAKPDVTSDLYAACMLVCEVWSRGFLCDSDPVTSPGGADNDLIRNALSSLATERPTMQEFAARLELIRLPAANPTGKKTVGQRKGFLDWLTGLIPALGNWIKDRNLAKGRDGTWRKDT